MEPKGLRINEKKNHVVAVKLKDILSQVVSGNEFVWSILYLNGVGSPNDISNLELSKIAFSSPKGYILDWDKLKSYSEAIDPIDWITLIGCREEFHLTRYKDDEEMYLSTDYCIRMFDSSYWEIFTKEDDFYNNVIKNFDVIAYLDVDFQKKQ